MTLENLSLLSVGLIFNPIDRYTVMAGMPQKMLEHLLETRLDARHLSAREEDIVLNPYSSATDMFLDDYLLTHIMFMPTHQLITELMRKYPFYTMMMMMIVLMIIIGFDDHKKRKHFLNVNHFFYLSDRVTDTG